MNERRVTLPAGWYLGAHGDPVAQFTVESVVLVFHDDGSVTWEQPGETP